MRTMMLKVVLVAILAAVALTGCGSDPCDGLVRDEECDDVPDECDILAAKLDACFPDQGGGGETAECTDTQLVLAQCINGKLDETCTNLSAAAVECSP